MTWDMRSNMKAKPGSQGILFRGGKDQMTDARWPRGYTPERLHEVLPSVGGGSKYYTRGEEGTHGTGPDRRQLVDTVARSTVPAHHLQNLQFLPGLLSVEGGEAIGSYRRKGTRVGEGTAHEHGLHLAKGFADTPHAIHEIGHHVSHEQADHSGYDTPEERGQEEAFADDYAQQHYKPRRGQTYGGQSLYADGFPGAGRTAEFYAAYRAHRATPIKGADLPDRAAKEAQVERDNPTLPGLDKYSSDWG